MKKLVAFTLTVFILVSVITFINRRPDESLGELKVTPPPALPIPPIKPQTPPVPPPPKIFSFDEAKSQISQNHIQQAMVYLTSNELEGRMSGKKGNESAANYVADQFKSFGLKPANNGSYFQPFYIRNVNNYKEEGNGQTSNVIGYIPGDDQYIIIGAHLDHIGYGPTYSRAPNRREIHPGADDNASGTCALLEIAKAFSLLKGQNKHTIVFMAFSAEEMGLLGSAHYCRNPIFPLDKTIFMLNMDMIGRYSGNGNLGCLGAGRSNELRQAAEAVSTSLRIKITDSAGGGSDQETFQRYQIPNAFMHTGLHSQYHTPDDTASRIDFLGLTEIAKFTFNFCWNVDKGVKPQLTTEYVPSNKPFKDHNQ